MRIALIFEFGSLNGGEHSMLAVIDHSRAAGVEFVALAPAEGPLRAALESRGVSVIPVDVRDELGRRRLQDDVLADLCDKLTTAKCELAHANSLAMGRLTGAIADRLPIRFAAHLRDIVKLSKAAIADLNQNTKLLAVSEATRRFHIAQGLDPDRISTLYNGVDCEIFQPRTPDGSIRRELGLSADDFLVLTVGQIGLRKGQDVLAAAARVLEDRLPHVRYLLAGQRCSEKEESRAYEEQLIASFQSLGKGECLRLLGYRDDMPALMNAADILVHPAHQEPLGRVLLESAASGLPIIATDVGGTAEILTHQKSALLVPSADPEAIALAIQTLAGDAELRDRLAVQARKRVLQAFSIETAAKNLHALWASLL